MSFFHSGSSSRGVHSSPPTSPANGTRGEQPASPNKGSFKSERSQRDSPERRPKSQREGDDEVPKFDREQREKEHRELERSYSQRYAKEEPILGVSPDWATKSSRQRR